jgi:SAM-dependent methyltransferase
MKKLLLIVLLHCALFASEDSEAVFTSIYRYGGWGVNEEGEGYSGDGSTLPNTAYYVAFLEQFIKTNNIKSVVDAGCGDWTFSKNIDWNGAQYLGVDTVKSVIEKNIQKYQTDTIRFQHFDMLIYELPAADLLICKDVLMHLPSRDILSFLKSTKKFKHCLFTNNTGPENLNHDIQKGEFRPLDLTAAPFYLNGLKVFIYSTDHGNKEVLYHGN